MDEEAFLPLRSEELAPQIAVRTLQYCHLVDDVTDKLVAEGVASVKGLKATGALGWYGRYLKLKEHGCCLMFDAEAWATLRETPIWLSVTGPDWKVTAQLLDALAPLENQVQPRMLRDDSELLIPLALPMGVEREAVVDKLLMQVKEVVALLRA
jgi:hypothetical protein